MRKTRDFWRDQWRFARDGDAEAWIFWCAIVLSVCAVVCYVVGFWQLTHA